MKYYFPLHLDGDNRGCEAIAKGTAILLQEPPSNLIGLCTNVALDKRLGVSDYISLIEAPTMSKFNLLLRKAHRIIAPQRAKHMEFVYNQRYGNFLNSIPPDGVVLITGGDMYCYENNEAVYTTTRCQNNGIKTILWGCSIGQNNITPEKLRNLKNFDLVYVRESFTEEVLRNNGITKIIKFPDPAFILEPEETSLPEEFEKKSIIGLNLSNFVIGDMKKLKMASNLVDYILNNTEYSIMLLPHVLWDNQSDILTSNKIKDLYKNNDRVFILNSASYNYCQLRYIISKCKFFIGARTHSVISAYSTCTPSLALSYSIKSRGIAKDLLLNEKLVVDSTNDIYDNKLVDAFKYIDIHEDEIRKHLQSVIPTYKDKLRYLKNEIVRYI